MRIQSRNKSDVVEERNEPIAISSDEEVWEDTKADKTEESDSADDSDDESEDEDDLEVAASSNKFAALADSE